MKKFDKMISSLKKDDTIPEYIWSRYTDTLSNLPEKKVADKKAIDKKTLNKDMNHSYKKPRKWWLVVVAATLIIGTVTVSAAVYMQWSKSLGEGLQTTQTQRQEMEENQMTSFVNQSVTQGDITVTAQQSIVDTYSAYLSFKVEGYHVADGVQPGFSRIDVVIGDGIDNDGMGGWYGSFYDGLIMDASARAIHADGTPLLPDEKDSYTLEDGTMEYRIVMNATTKGYFIDQPIHVEFKDLGVYKEKAGDVAVEAEGVWSFDWTLAGSDSTVHFDLNEPLGDSGATVLQVEMSPLSIDIIYDFPKQESQEKTFDEEGNEVDHTSYEEPPSFVGARMKDGTMYTGLFDGGTAGHLGNGTDTYRYRGSLGQVIDVDQVESLLFRKSNPEEGQPYTDDNFYFVPVT